MRLLLDFSPEEYRTWLLVLPDGYEWPVAHSPTTEHCGDPLSDFIWSTLSSQEQGLSDAVVVTCNTAKLTNEGERYYREYSAILPDWCAALAEHYMNYEDDITLTEAIYDLAAMQDDPRSFFATQQDIPSDDPQ